MSRRARGTDWATFRTELESLYEPPMRSRNTRNKIRQALALIEGAGPIATAAELTPSRIGRIVKNMEASTIATATAIGNLSYVRAVCAYAVATGELRSSPWSYRRDWLRSFRAGREEDPPPPRHFAAAEIAAVLGLLEREAAGGDWKAGRLEAAVAIVAYAGLRKMEALCLRVADIDLAAGMIRIRKHSRRLLKTRASAQPVPVPGPLAAVLARWLPRLGATEWLIPAVRGLVPWTSGDLGRRPLDFLRAAGERAGVPGLSFQALRHSWATHAEQLWGLSEPAIARVLRHTSTRTSREHYRHADEADLRAIAARIDYGTAALPCPGG